MNKLGKRFIAASLAVAVTTGIVIKTDIIKSKASDHESNFKTENELPILGETVYEEVEDGVKYIATSYEKDNKRYVQMRDESSNQRQELVYDMETNCLHVKVYENVSENEELKEYKEINSFTVDVDKSIAENSITNEVEEQGDIERITRGDRDKSGWLETKKDGWKNDLRYKYYYTKGSGYSELAIKRKAVYLINMWYAKTNVALLDEINHFVDNVDGCREDAEDFRDEVAFGLYETVMTVATDTIISAMKGEDFKLEAVKSLAKAAILTVIPASHNAVKYANRASDHYAEAAYYYNRIKHYGRKIEQWPK